MEDRLNEQPGPPVEVQIEDQEPNNVIPMNKVEDQPVQSGTNNYIPPNQYSDNTYCLSKIFIVYIVQTLLSVLCCKLGILNKTEYYLPTLIFILIAVTLLGAVRGYDKWDQNNICGIMLIIYFFVFKICFYIFFYYIIYKIGIQNLFNMRTETPYTFDDPLPEVLGTFDFANMAMFVFYLALIIFNCIKKEVILLTYFIIGMIICLIMFLSLLSINVAFAGFCALFIFIELSILILVIKVAISQQKLEEDNFINNILILDFYKYVIIMVIALIVLTILIYLIYFICLVLRFCCECLRPKPNTVDSHGNVYDQYGNSMGHYSKKPKYVDSEGNVYDKHKNKIEPDCVIF